MSTRRLEVVFIGDTRSLDAAVRRTQAEVTGLSGTLHSTGRKMTAVGRKLTHGISVPLALIAGASIKAATDFDASMERIHTQAGASQKEVDRLKDAVLELSHSLPQSPQELSKGLYHLESVGLHGAKAMRALKVAALGAAVGGADLENVATALGSAWLVNIKGAGSFKHTMAILNAVVGAGNMRMGDLVSALGTGILPMAKEAGLGIKDIGASMALLADEGWPATKASRLLGTSLHYLYAPSSAASKALKQIGLNGTELAEKMHGPQGLLGALKLLHAHLDKLPGGIKGVKAGQLLAKILPAGRGKVLVTLLNQLGRYQVKLRQIAKSTGQYGEDVAKTQETASFRIHKAWDGIQSAAVNLGHVLLPVFLPIFEKLTDLVGKAAEWFAKLPGPVKKFAVGFILAAAAIGPLLTMLGALLEGAALLLSPWTAVALVAILIATNWKKVKAVLAVVWGALKTAATAAFSAIEWAAKHFLLGPVPWIIANWNRLPQAFLGILKGALNVIRSLGGALLGVGKWLVRTIIAGIKNMPAALGTAAGWLIGTYLLFIKDAVLLIVHVGKWIVNRLIDGIRAMPGALAAVASWLAHRFVDGVRALPGLVVNVGSWVVHRLVDGVRATPKALLSAASWLIHKYIDLLKGEVKIVLDVGKWIAQRIMDGILAVPKLIAHAVGSFVSHLIGAIKDKLGIKSPSRVFMGIGRHVMAGLLHGIVNHPLGFALKHLGSLGELAKDLLLKGLLKVPGLTAKAALAALKGGFGALKSVAGSIGGFVSGLFGGGGGKVTGDGYMATVRGWLESALRLTGHYSGGNLRALFGRTMQESGGNPRAVNLWDSNAQAGHPSKGLLQTIDSTFQRYRMKGLGDIWNPIANAVAAIRYMFATYGHIVGPSAFGYATGGIVGQRVRVGELGPEDVYLPLGSRVVQASETARHHGGPLIGEVNIYGQSDERMIARELAWKIATAPGG